MVGDDTLGVLRESKGVRLQCQVARNKQMRNLYVRTLRDRDERRGARYCEDALGDHAKASEGAVGARQ